MNYWDYLAKCMGIGANTDTSDIDRTSWQWWRMYYSMWLAEAVTTAAHDAVVVSRGDCPEFSHQIEYFNQAGELMSTEVFTANDIDSYDAWFRATDAAQAHSYTHQPCYANFEVTRVA